MIRDHQIVGGFICYFWLMTILSSQKLKNVKYRFWLQKGVENHIRYVFLIRDPQIEGSKNPLGAEISQKCFELSE